MDRDPKGREAEPTRPAAPQTPEGTAAVELPDFFDDDFDAPTPPRGTRAPQIGTPQALDPPAPTKAPKGTKPAAVPPAMPAPIPPPLPGKRWNIGRRSSGRRRRRDRTAAVLAEPEPRAAASPTAQGPPLKRNLLIGAAVAVVGSIIIVAINRSREQPPGPMAATAATPEPRPPAAAQREPNPAATAMTDPALRDHFRQLVADEQREAATRALGELAERGGKLLAEPATRRAVLDLLVLVADLDGAAADQAFEVVATKLGTLGPDLLFELYTTRGGTVAARRADELLRDEDLRQHATPALRVAYDLRMAPNCDAVAIQLIRARREGDGRAKSELERVHTCAEGAKCCMRGNERVAAVIRSLDLKLRSTPADGGIAEEGAAAPPEPTAPGTVEPATPLGTGTVPAAPATATFGSTTVGAQPTTPTTDEGATPVPRPPGGGLYD